MPWRRLRSVLTVALLSILSLIFQSMMCLTIFSFPYCKLSSSIIAPATSAYFSHRSATPSSSRNTANILSFLFSHSQTAAQKHFSALRTSSGKTQPFRNSTNADPYSIFLHQPIDDILDDDPIVRRLRQWIQCQKILRKRISRFLQRCKLSQFR